MKIIDGFGKSFPIIFDRRIRIPFIFILYIINKYPKQSKNYTYGKFDVDINHFNSFSIKLEIHPKGNSKTEKRVQLNIKSKFQL